MWEDSNLRKWAKSLINMARPDGLEPPTTWFEARYSIQLSYGRVREQCIVCGV